MKIRNKTLLENLERVNNMPDNAAREKLTNAIESHFRGRHENKEITWRRPEYFDDLEQNFISTLELENAEEVKATSRRIADAITSLENDEQPIAIKYYKDLVRTHIAGAKVLPTKACQICGVENL